MESLAKAVLIISLVIFSIIFFSILWIVKIAFPFITGWWWALAIPVVSVVSFVLLIIILKIIPRK